MGIFEASSKISGSATTMGLTSALAAAMSGARSAQAPLPIVPSNVARTNRPGRGAQNPKQTDAAGSGSMVAPAGINHELDLFLQNQLRTEISGGAYADQIANILGRLQGVYGTDGGDGGLEGGLGNFTAALQSLLKSPNSPSAQSAALSAAQTLARKLNSTTKGIQTLRSDVEQDIGNAAGKANAAMAQIADLNARLESSNASDPLAAPLQDQRDDAINTLARYVDIRTAADAANGVSVFTNSGVQLVGADAASEFTFTSPGTLQATSLYSADPARNGVGRLNLALANGSSVDVAANNLLGSGRIAADLKLRDRTLAQAQVQVDQLAAGMAAATTTVPTLANGNGQLPLFTDAGAPYTGSIIGAASQAIGLAGRIAVNPALVADPGKISPPSTSSSSTAAGNSARPDVLLAQLTATKFTFSPATGLGSAAQPFEGTMTSYLQQFIGQQGNAATLATQLQQGQSIVVSTLQQKLNATAAVDMDSEMMNLIQVQNSYAANAHIMSVVQDVMKGLAPPVSA
jgi:flagellar hook-associated protein FlgK